MANESIWKRPKAGIDEEELLRQQEEFIKAKQLPSANINLQSSVKNQSKSTNVDKVVSQFSKLRKQNVVSTSEGSGKIINSDIEDKIQDNSEKEMTDVVNYLPKVIPKTILGNIVVKYYDKDYKVKDTRPVFPETGFPPVFKIDWDNMEFSDKESIYMQHMRKLGINWRNPDKIQSNKSANCNKEKVNIEMEDQLITEIHKENLEKLAQMSKAEILQEKKKLEETLDPKILQFLKNKKNKRSEKRSHEQDTMQHSILATSKVTIDTEVCNDKKMKLSLHDSYGTKVDCEDNMLCISAAKKITDVEVFSDEKKLSSNDNDTKMDYKDDTLSIPKLPKEILEESKEKGWLHMDLLEPEKLKWMDDLPEEKKDEPVPSEDYNARFDFNGILLPYKDASITLDKGLHHHGEEPARPGYALQELLQLTRSSTQQQRCTSLTTLANIMEKTHKGWYDKALYPGPLTALSQKNILLLLRFSLDDSSIAVVTAALEALRAFLVSEADEICLDRLYGFDGYVEPSLAPQLENKDTGSLKDHELAQLDAVATLLRSDFLLRINYILNEMHPSPIGVICALEILIRLARHSYTTALNIASMPHFLNIIINNFMPLSTSQLAMQDMINNIYGIPVVQAVKLCRVLVTYGKKSVARKLGNLKIIKIILAYITNDAGGKHDVNLSIESLRLWRMLLHYEIELNSVSDSFLILFPQIQLLLDNHNIQNTSELACEHAAALIAIGIHDKRLVPNILNLITKWSSQFLMISNTTWGVMKLIAKTLSAVSVVHEFRTTSLSFQHGFSTLRSSSNLLSDCNLATDRDPSCLPNLNVLMENGELQPIVSVNSCIPFLATILNIFNKFSLISEIRVILEHPSFYKYIRDLEANEWNLERSWYSRMELYLLTEMVKAAFLLRNTINNRTAQIVWKIAIKLISALPADATNSVKDLLQIALTKEKVNLEVITNELSKLDLASTVDQDKIYRCSDVALLYQRYVTLNGDWNQAAMPKDWIFLPLIHLYTKCKNDVRLQPQDKDNVLAVLSLASILSDHMDKLSPSLRFSRLMLVYLCDTVYLDKDISVLLVNIVSILLKKYHARLDFRTELPGLSSFTDLFTASCEHFCGSSYGDDGFAMILLVPIAQRHDVHYRKLLWSEHAGVLRYLRLSLNKLMVPLKEYLYPEEDDTSLIESYITALIRETIKETWCPVPFIIALHHSAMYLRRTNKLAMRMRTQVEKLRNRDIADKLLHYEPPQL